MRNRSGGISYEKLPRSRRSLRLSVLNRICEISMKYMDETIMLEVFCQDAETGERLPEKVIGIQTVMVAKAEKDFRVCVTASGDCFGGDETDLIEATCSVGEVRSQCKGLSKEGHTLGLDPGYLSTNGCRWQGLWCCLLPLAASDESIQRLEDTIGRNGIPSGRDQLRGWRRRPRWSGANERGGRQNLQNEASQSCKERKAGDREAGHAARQNENLA